MSVEDSPVTKQAMAIMEEQARRVGLDPAEMRLDARIVLTLAAQEACIWLRQHSPGRALEALETALEKAKHL